jgi:predicted transcriptional regulator
MTTITLEPEDDQIEKLRAAAALWGSSVDELVMAAVEALDVDRTLSPYSPEQEAAIREGLADIEAGRVYDHDAVMAEARRVLETK